MAIVIDASATLSWLFGEDDPGEWIENHLQAGRLIAPSLWQLEVAHAVLKKERQRHLTRQQADSFLGLLDALPIEIVPPPLRTLQQIAVVARPHQLSAYDATYLDLVIRRQAELLTLDQNLRDAARRLGIPLIEKST
ncbi:type II toxin-antitoxin system VapC family toxin [Planctomicrobium piriforme]|uniref:Ribonuclease VapC n=1 Tax=Planctomicrobium piriforme TaxID=1576369 RepID=A0A1I3KZ58_9PLAN|nr:type II toxin-antitoxin system VapC family toxin [Planctomicrobium piriforme]SFI77789.1 Predicted nucleic acid-binding protein, contains PIN domain [Planctomicrobium piriforme]